MPPSIPGYIDLHIHSSCSDGALTPTALMNEARRLDLTAVAIADHDTTAAVDMAARQAAQNGIELIPAVELSVQYGPHQDVHLLGYGIDHTDAGFRATLDGFRQSRAHRNGEILDRINQRLVHEGRTPLTLDEVLVHAGDSLGRPHIARALLGRGYVKSVEDAFRRYLTPCNVPKRYWPMEEAIPEIRRLGGIAVLAHPTSITQDMTRLWGIITELKRLGLDGIEVYNNQAMPEEMDHLRRRAQEGELLMTGGSDFHGIEAGLEMGKGRGGIRFSADLLAPLRERLEQRRRG